MEDKILIGKKLAKEPNVYLYTTSDNIKISKNVLIITGMKWHLRLWYMISNPFTYLFTGKIRY